MAPRQAALWFLGQAGRATRRGTAGAHQRQVGKPERGAGDLLTEAVLPEYVLPNHYDVMALNSENPQTFRSFVSSRKLSAKCVIVEPIQPFVRG